ncbi:MAG: hypothetical protein ACLPHP_20500 [Candidatus Sulfotelmatobacter sp.]
MTKRSILTLILVLTFGLTNISCGSGNHLVSIAVTPNPASLSAPETLQLKAIGTYSNGATVVLNSANWALSDQVPWITLNNSGLVTCSIGGGPAYGAPTVTASFAGLSGSAQLVCTGPGV